MRSSAGSYCGAQSTSVSLSINCLPEYQPLCVCGLAWPQGCSLSRVLQPEALHLEKGDLLKSVHLYARSLREHRMRSDQGGHVLVVLPSGLQNKEMDKLAWPVPGLAAPLWTQLQGRNQLAGERRVKIGDGTEPSRHGQAGRLEMYKGDLCWTCLPLGSMGKSLACLWGT